MLTPRHYQADALQSLIRFFYEVPDGNPVVALPTGTGKSLVIAEFIRHCMQTWPGMRFLMLTHVKELIQQNFDELLAVWPTAPVGIYSAGLKRRDTTYPITFCGVASVAKKVEQFGHIDIVLVDECHLVSDKEGTNYKLALDSLRRINPNVRVIGLSATPYRQGAGHLVEGGIFTHLCCDWTSMDRFNQLVDEGFICPLYPRRTDLELDLDSVSIRGGEYAQEEVAAIVDKEEITRAALAEMWQKGGWNRKHWLIFASSVEHADHIAETMNSPDFVARALHERIKKYTHLPPEARDRDQVFRDYKAGKIRALVTYGMGTTGFNFKPIDLIGMLRKTRSPSLWVQMLGRGTRPSPETGKTDCLVFDFARNSLELGPINDPVLPRKKGKGPAGKAPTKICAACGTYNHARAVFCFYCQSDFPAVVHIEASASDAELIRKEKKPPEVIPVVELPVTGIKFDKHLPRDTSKPPSLKVTLFCGLKIFSDWWCLEHSGYGGKKARVLWRYFEHPAIRGDEEPPASIDEALDRVGSLLKPAFARVLMNPKFPQVLGYTFGDLSTAVTVDAQSLD